MAALHHLLQWNWRDARAFGPGFVLRHLSKARGAVRHGWELPGIGRVTVRLRSTDIDVMRQVFQWREYDLSKFPPQYARLRARYQAMLARGEAPVILDLGANMGASALWFAREFPDAAVVSVEPDAGNAAICRENIAGHAQIALHEAAIGSAPGSIAIDDVWGGEWALRTRRIAGGGVPVVTIPDLLATVPAGRLFIAKIDIEGFESDLFERNIGWIDDAAAILIETHDWMRPSEGTSFALQKAMGERRFEIMVSGENLVYFNSADAGNG